MCCLYKPMPLGVTFFLEAIFTVIVFVDYLLLSKMQLGFWIVPCVLKSDIAQHSHYPVTVQAYILSRGLVIKFCYPVHIFKMVFIDSFCKNCLKDKTM